MRLYADCVEVEALARHPANPPRSTAHGETLPLGHMGSRPISSFFIMLKYKRFIYYYFFGGPFGSPFNVLRPAVRVPGEFLAKR